MIAFMLLYLQDTRKHTAENAFVMFLFLQGTGKYIAEDAFFAVPFFKGQENIQQKMNFRCSFFQGPRKYIDEDAILLFLSSRDKKI